MIISYGSSEDTVRDSTTIYNSIKIHICSLFNCFSAISDSIFEAIISFLNIIKINLVLCKVISNFINIISQLEIFFIFLCFRRIITTLASANQVSQTILFPSITLFVITIIKCLNWKLVFWSKDTNVNYAFSFWVTIANIFVAEITEAILFPVKNSELYLDRHEFVSTQAQPSASALWFPFQ